MAVFSLVVVTVILLTDESPESLGTRGMFGGGLVPLGLADGAPKPVLRLVGVGVGFLGHGVFLSSM
jgi:hypothetical protein